MNQTPLLYFAYGSNQNKRRAARRISGAVDLGVAVLPNYRLTERLYADIDFCEGAEVFGVLYLVKPEHIDALDRVEGYPHTYKRYWVEVEFNGERYAALTYEMTEETKAERNGKAYPEEYRKICSSGARSHGIPDQFNKERNQ